jgi:hypothetical protein
MTWSAHADDDLQAIDDIVEFLQGEYGVEGGVPSWSTEYLRWKLGSANPAGRGYVSLARSGGKVVGVVTLTRKRILMDGREMTGGEVGDTYTSARLRRSGAAETLSARDPNPESFVNKSIFGRLASDTFERASADGVTVVYGTPNENAFPGWTKRLDWGVVRNENYFCYSRPTASYFVKRLRWLKPIAPLLSLGDWAVVKAQLAAVGATGPRVEVSGTGLVDDEIDALWDAIRPSNGFSLVRDARYWRHRYEENPLCRYTLLNFRIAGELAGIASLRVTHMPALDKNVLSLVEWMSSSAVPFVRLALLALDAASLGSRVDVVNFWASAEALGRDAKRMLFMRRAAIPIILGPNIYGRAVGDMRRFEFHIGSSDAL